MVESATAPSADAAVGGRRPRLLAHFGKLAKTFANTTCYSSQFSKVAECSIMTEIEVDFKQSWGWLRVGAMEPHFFFVV